MTYLSNNSPFVLSQITNQVRTVSGIISQPIDDITGILSLKILLMNPVQTLDFLASLVGIKRDTIWLSINMSRETFKNICGERVLNTIDDFYALVIENFIQFSSVAQSLLDVLTAFKALISYAVCALKVAYGTNDSESDTSHCCPDTHELIHFLISYDQFTNDGSSNKTMIKGFNKHTKQELIRVWKESPLFDNNDKEEYWVIKKMKEKWYSESEKKSIARRLLDFATVPEDELGNFITLAGTGLKNSL